MAEETTNTQGTESKTSSASTSFATLAPFHPAYQLVIRNNHANEENTGQSGSKEQTTTEQPGEAKEPESGGQDANYFLVDPIGDVTLSRERKIAPAKLTFKSFADGLDVKEGNACEFSVDGTKVFKGFLFAIKR